jgi:polar amino acid transport system substrate-binding protein
MNWKIAGACLALIVLTACATSSGVPSEAKSQLAPTGKLRVGLNFGNILLVSKGPAGGEPRGVVIGIARELGRRIGTPVQFVNYDSPGRLGDAAGANEWDVAFLAVEPVRAALIDFSPPYVEIEATYLVRESSKLRAISDMDREGLRIAVGAKSAYDLFLTRTLQRATLIRTENTGAAMKELLADKADAVAGIKQMLLDQTGSVSGLRLIDGRFTAVQQAIGTPRGRDEAAKYLKRFVEDIRSSGFLASTIQQNSARGLTIAQ